FLHDGKPGGEILRVIGAGLVGDLKIGTEEGSAKRGDKHLHRIGVIAEALSKLPVAAGCQVASPAEQAHLFLIWLPSVDGFENAAQEFPNVRELRRVATRAQIEGANAREQVFCRSAEC